MKYKPETIPIPQDKPYEYDQLKRQECGNSLKSLIINAGGPLVVSLNGGWVTGKTIFLKMWRQDLENDGFTTIYFSAWDDDYCDDAIVALIGQLWKNIKRPDCEEIVQSIKECAAPVFRSTLLNAVKTMSAGIVDLKEEQLKSISEKAVDEYINAGEKLQELKNKLTELAEKVSASGKPLVIIVDELDRCRPIFAIELLEKVKHLFDIPGIVFVLGVDREQLGHSIKSIYGQDMVVDGYLSRFVDLNFMLPEGNKSIFVRHLINIFGLDSFFAERKQSKYRHEDELDSFSESFTDLSEVFGLSLRDIEHCVRLLVVTASNTELANMMLPRLLSILIILRHVNLNLYREFLDGICNSEKIIEYILEQPTGQQYMNGPINSGGLITEAFLVAVSRDDWLKKISSQLPLLQKGEKPTVPDLPVRYLEMPKGRISDLIRVFSWLSNMGFRGVDTRSLKYLTDKIELASLITK